MNRFAYIGLAAAVVGAISIAAEAFAWQVGLFGWSNAEVEAIQSLRIDNISRQAVDPSNRFQGNPDAIRLGEQLFADVRLSGNGQVACATCHVQEKQFQDGLALAKGLQVGTRRTMPVVGLSHSPWLFWDGRKDSAWSQALGPLEAGAEHGGNRTKYARLVAAHYRAQYEALFGPLPATDNLPQDAGPMGAPDEQLAWSRLSREQQIAVNRVFSNLGKSIAAYEATFTYGESRFDKYARALAEDDANGQRQLTLDELRGLRLFVGKGQCVTCHNGALFTDQAFHNTGVPQRDPRTPDLGRAAALDQVKSDEFNCLGQYSDAKPDACEELTFMSTSPGGLEAAFKTPSLRNVATRAPYMHAGQLSTLDEVIRHYVKAPRSQVGHSELASPDGTSHQRKPIQLSAEEIQQVAAFLATLSSPIVKDVRAHTNTRTP